MKIHVETDRAERDFASTSEALGALEFAGVQPSDATISLILESRDTPSVAIETVSTLMLAGASLTIDAIAWHPASYVFPQPDDEDATQTRLRLHQTLGALSAALI